MKLYQELGEVPDDEIKADGLMLFAQKQGDEWRKEHNKVVGDFMASTEKKLFMMYWHGVYEGAYAQYHGRGSK